MLFRLATKWQFWAVVAVLLIPVASVQADALIPNMTYTYVHGPSAGNYADDGLTKLTDGVSYTDGGFGWGTNAGWEAPSNPTMDVIFDLHGSYDVQLVQPSYPIWDFAGIGGWDAMTVKMSNNADMSDPVYTKIRTVADGTLTADPSWVQGGIAGDDTTLDHTYPGNLWVREAGVSNTTARYIELIGTPHSYSNLNPAGGWGMMDEVRIAGTLVPEPGACVLSFTGLIALLAYAWRKRK